MRWDNLLANQDGEETEITRLPLFPGEAIVRRFKTPQFRGMTFYEVAAKSIINHVPGDRYGFNWTINPYRGCSHACSYCLLGDTPILMADGRTKPLADLKTGELVYGTNRDGRYLRYVPTPVLDHWCTVRQGFRVVLEDGTELIASADHRFLTNRGWKHVIGSQHGPEQRPHLTPGIKLCGFGQFARPPRHDADYRRGYVCGMVRGDGNLASYCYDGARRAKDTVHRFRLALVDIEALRRTREFLSSFDVPTTEFAFQQAVGGRKPLQAIHSQSGPSIERIRELIAWPAAPSEAWTKGFLAGIFDAEGSHSGSLRIANTDTEIVDWVSRCLAARGFRFCVEVTKNENGLRYITLLGGLREILRFFLTVDPAITRKRTINGIAMKSDAPLHVVAIEPLGVEMPLYDITTGTSDFIANGVISHNCFARPTHTYLDFDAGRDFETKIVVKVNAPDLLRRELRRASWRGELIAMGTNTDPYQRAEGHYRLMRGILRELNAARNPYSILTKGTLIQRDLDLLVEGAAITEVSANFSVGTVDEKVWAETEPGTPHPMKRLEVVRMLNEAGVSCGVLMAPILPGISDRPEQLEATVAAAAAAGATHVTPIALHLRPGVKEEFWPWLTEHHPELVPAYTKIYRGSYASKTVTEPIGRQVAELRRRHGVARTRPTGGRGPAEARQPDTPETPEMTNQEPSPAGASPAPPEGTHEAPKPQSQLSLDLGPAPARKAPARARLRGPGEPA